VGEAISLVSCLEGAFATVVIWKICQTLRHPKLAFAVALSSGYLLLFHGSTEVYALPTAILALWILAIQRVDRGEWPALALPMVFAFMAWTHLVTFFLFPSLVLSGWLYRERIASRDLRYWIEGPMIACGVLVLFPIIEMNLDADLMHPLNEIFGPPKIGTYYPFFSMEHLWLKLSFLWIGTGVVLPFALLALWRNRTDRVVLQIGSLSLCALVFFVAFHPDLGYDDWDLFLFPSLPISILGAYYISQSNRRHSLAAVVMAVFLTIWIPRVPVWARLQERGLSKVAIDKFPTDARVLLDDRYPVEHSALWVGGGMHTLSIHRSGDLVRWKVFRTAPGETLSVSLPEERVSGPFASQVHAMAAEPVEDGLTPSAPPDGSPR
jgi:hypothetical protein